MSDVIDLPSGAKLKVTPAPFKDAKALYQACLEELKGLNLDPKQEIDANFFKGLFCVGFSSQKIEAALYKCFQRCTYNGNRIVDDSIFEVFYINNAEATLRNMKGESKTITF